MDMLQLIKNDFETVVDERNAQLTMAYGNWLIAEVGRLRKIEDAAVAWHISNGNDDGYVSDDMVENLGDVIDANPRPTDGGS